MTRRNRLSRAGLAMVAVVALLDLYLGIYHLTHHGLGSGITELVSVSLLVIAGYLISQAGKTGGNLSAKR
jgi:hypothetical protein